MGEEKTINAKFETLEQVPIDPDVVRIIERVLCQSETILRTNAKLLEVITFPMQFVGGICTLDNKEET